MRNSLHFGSSAWHAAWVLATGLPLGCQDISWQAGRAQIDMTGCTGPATVLLSDDRISIDMPTGNCNEAADAEELREIVNQYDANISMEVLSLSGTEFDDVLSANEEGMVREEIPLILYGGSGDDTLIGGLADITMYGGPGNDEFVDNNRSAVCFGGDGDDTFFGVDAEASGSNTFVGESGADTYLYSGGVMNIRSWDASDRTIVSEAAFTDVSCVASSVTIFEELEPKYRGYKVQIWFYEGGSNLGSGSIDVKRDVAYDTGVAYAPIDASEVMPTIFIETADGVVPLACEIN